VLSSGDWVETIGRDPWARTEVGVAIGDVGEVVAVLGEGVETMIEIDFFAGEVVGVRPAFLRQVDAATFPRAGDVVRYDDEDVIAVVVVVDGQYLHIDIEGQGMAIAPRSGRGLIVDNSPGARARAWASGLRGMRDEDDFGDGVSGG
jgi:hypothetical protein